MPPVPQTPKLSNICRFRCGNDPILLRSVLNFHRWCDVTGNSPTAPALHRVSVLQVKSELWLKHQATRKRAVGSRWAEQTVQYPGGQRIKNNRLFAKTLERQNPNPTLLGRTNTWRLCQNKRRTDTVEGLRFVAFSDRKKAFVCRCQMCTYRYACNKWGRANSLKGGI